MRTVHEVSELAGVSVRTLQYYDRIGLLRPTTRSQAGYRLYSDDDLARLQQILLFRELEFPLADIREIIESPGFDRARALQQHIELLTLRRERLDGLIDLAKRLKEEEVAVTEFDAFDTSKIDEYAAAAKQAWGGTVEWRDYERKSAGRTREEENALGSGLMELFKPFGAMAAAGEDPASEAAREQARRIQAYISEHFYACSDEVFVQLGVAYGAGGDFTRNIDAAAGEGAGAFAARAVKALLMGR